LFLLLSPFGKQDFGQLISKSRIGYKPTNHPPSLIPSLLRFDNFGAGEDNEYIGTPTLPVRIRSAWSKDWAVAELADAVV